MESRQLVERMVAAYRPYIMGRLAELGIDAPHSLPEALEEGERWLEQTLTALLELPFAAQTRGPLEVFQEAMRFPTRALAKAGVQAVRRDPRAEKALPGDRYDLAPASSSSLGEGVWRAHLAWGASKAAVVAPTLMVGLFSANLMDRSRVEEAARAAGRAVVAWGSLSELERDRRPVGSALVDLAHPEAASAIQRLVAAGLAPVAFGPHVDEAALSRAVELGAALALPRSRFFRRLPELVGGTGSDPTRPGVR